MSATRPDILFVMTDQQRFDTIAALGNSHIYTPNRTKRKDLEVRTEYGTDFWRQIFEAGFRKVTLTSLIFPGSIAIHAIKILES